MSDDLAVPESGGAAPLGAALAAARQARGLSVEDVAAATRIRATLVRALEADDFSRCGGLVYARGHVKSIAQVVGADSRALMAEFDRRHERAVPPLVASPLPASEPPRGLGRDRQPSARWASVAIGMLAVVTVLLAVSWFIGGGRDNRDPVGASPAGVATTAPAAPAPSQQSPPATAPPNSAGPPARAGVRLRVHATGGDSWLLVTSSTGSQVYQGILTSGKAQEFRDRRQLTVKFGNSRAVTLTLNGRDLGAPSCGDVVCSQEFARSAAG